MIMQYAWFIWTLCFLLAWILLYLFNDKYRKEMLWVSFGTLPLGLTEPLFVPNYWNPPTLFHLAQRTGFDIESLIFCFSIGGVGSVIYQIIFKIQEVTISDIDKHHKHHRWHLLALATPIIVFFLLALFAHLNHIYCGIIAMFLGALATLYCRPDLKYKIWIGGILFLIFYAAFFLSLTWVFPDYVAQVWNLKALSGIMILGIPIEEFLFAFSFGMLWSSIYEHVLWLKLVKSIN
jgi:hypothetical protein